MPSRYRRPLAVAAVLIAVAGGGIYAWASHSSNPVGAALTSSNGTQILVQGGSAISPRLCDDTTCTALTAAEAQWSPDGSRAVFVDDVGGIDTVRYNDPDDAWLIADPASDTERHHPTYNDAGDTVFWSQKVTGGHFRVVATSSSYQFKINPITPGDTNDYTDPDGGPGNKVVMQRTPSGGGTAMVVLWDGDNAGTITDVIPGTDPAISPNGAAVAFVAGGQIWRADINGSNPQQLTTDTGANYTNPTWFPDGNTIAFNSGSAVLTVSAAGGAVTTQSGLSGPPAYRSQRANSTVRLAGLNRYTTATAVSKSFWATAGSNNGRPAQAVVLSRSDNFADALGGGALAAAKDGPLLLSSPSTLNSDTQAEMQRVLGATNKTVYLLGGTAALSTTVENQVKALGYTTARLAGLDRFATAVLIANAISPTPTMILAATGQNWPDALPAGAAAGSFDAPGASTQKAVLVLTNDSVMPAATQTYFNGHTSAEVIAVGNLAGTATKNLPQGRQLIAGSNRYATASLVALAFFSSEHHAGVATGDNWPDALSGGALMASLNGPLLLTPSTTSAGWAEFTLSTESASVQVALTFGGTSVVSDPLLTSFGVFISGPAGSTASATLPSSPAGPKRGR